MREEISQPKSNRIGVLLLIKRWMSCGRSFIKWSVGGFIFFVLALLGIDFITGYSVKDRIYTDINKLPDFHTAVVLGTAKFYSKGVPNLYYQYRVEAASQLVKEHQIKHLLVSGDNQTPYYNEPKVMTEDLLKMGVPKNIIQQDFAGYRTLDSVIRANKVFKLAPFIIISQQFHCERALFIAKTQNIDAVCLVAKYPEGHVKVRIREFFARIGMIWDYIVNNQPRTFEKVVAKELKTN